MYFGKTLIISSDIIYNEILNDFIVFPIIKTNLYNKRIRKFQFLMKLAEY